MNKPLSDLEKLKNENKALKYVLDEERRNYKRLEALYDILHKAITNSRAEQDDIPEQHLTAYELEQLEKKLFTAGLDIKLVNNNEKYLVQELVQRLVNLQEKQLEFLVKNPDGTKISVADVNRLNERFSRIGLDLQIITRDADTIIQELADELATIYVESHKAVDSDYDGVVFGTDEYDEPTD